MAIHPISHTAWLVLLSMATLSQDPRYAHLVEPDDAKLYFQALRYCERHFLTYRLVKWLLPPRIHLKLIESALLKGAPLHYVLRKDFIRRHIKKLIEADEISQLVVLGGGFDALALHTARHQPHIICFEFDLVKTQRHKAAIATEHMETLPDNLHFMPVDLSETSLFDALSSYPAFTVGKPTVFVAEGLSMYLTQAAMDSLIHDIRRLSPQATILFSAIEQANTKQHLSSVGAQVQQTTMRVSGEAFSWHMPMAEMADYLEPRGFTVVQSLSYAELQRSWRTDAEMQAIEPLGGEYMVAARSKGQG
ncbi:MAG: SAM-dependent methyltransferase [Rickettsiales bacterium]|nr:SAM-dependent methyltransferase [Rickettsiales bacterium]